MQLEDMNVFGYRHRFFENFFENFFLKFFKASKPDLLNIPPLDVHWVWHVHMLSPVSYREDCVAICGTVVDHKLLSADEVIFLIGGNLADSHICGQPPNFLRTPLCLAL